MTETQRKIANKYLGIKEKNIITDNKIWNSIYINGYYFLQVP